MLPPAKVLTSFPTLRNEQSESAPILGTCILCNIVAILKGIRCQCFTCGDMLTPLIDDRQYTAFVKARASKFSGNKKLISMH